VPTAYAFATNAAVAGDNTGDDDED